jgi:hypothetical protein
VVADTNRLLNPVFEMQLVGKNEWRALVPIAGCGLTNLTWRFKGVGEYVSGSESFSTGVTYWADSGELRRLPGVGTCAESGPEGRLSIPLDKGNYVALTLNTETLKFQACRAEYQNFNLWSAPSDVFSDGNGQDPKRTTLNTFDAWPVSQEETYLQAFAGYPSQTNIFISGPFNTLGSDFMAGHAAYVSERTLVDTTLTTPNVASSATWRLRLKAATAPGATATGTTGATPPDGLRGHLQASRAGCGQPPHYLVPEGFFTNFNYAIRDTARNSIPRSISPQTPSISRSLLPGRGEFYEYRVTQTTFPHWRQYRGQDGPPPASSGSRRCRPEGQRAADRHPSPPAIDHSPVETICAECPFFNEAETRISVHMPTRIKSTS